MPDRAQRIQWRGAGSNHAAAAKLLREPGDVSLVERGRPRWLLVNCPCGCRETISLNVDAGAGPAWRIYWSGSRLSVFPSVWKESGCESHFIVWRNRVDWLGSRYDEEVSEELRRAVLAALSPVEFTSFVEVAESLREVPWDVLQACRQLVIEGVAVEGHGKKRGAFRIG